MPQPIAHGGPLYPARPRTPMITEAFAPPAV